MLKDEFQSYLDAIYPNSKINDGAIEISTHIRFELGDEKENGTRERVDHSTNKAIILFYDAFPNNMENMWVFIHEFPGSNLFKGSENFLYSQFPVERFEIYDDFIEEEESDENGKKSLELVKVKFAIGKIAVREFSIENILRGIANNEMGFEPSIDQDIYFFNPTSNRAFHMYDDRGCFIFSNDAENIREIYIRRNDWIVDYHRHNIEQYFK
jgi:hypothetical protein